MGNTTSQESKTALQRARDIRLYKGDVSDGSQIEWVLMSENASPNFFDINLDVANSPPEWHLEFEGSVEYPDCVVDNTFEFIPKEMEVIFNSNGTYWALHFPDKECYSQFSQTYNKYLFENTYGCESNQENVEKELGYLATLGNYEGETEESRRHWVEDMDIDTPAIEQKTPGSHMKEHMAAESNSGLKSIIMGGLQNSYVFSESGIDVMRNTSQGLEDSSITFSFGNMSLGSTTPGVTGRRRSSLGARSTPNTITPSKAILMDRESKMNMLTPDSASIYSADIETGSIVNEYSIQKSGVEIKALDLVTDTKRSQLDSGSTFLSLGANSINRWDTRTKEGLAQTLASPVALTFEGGRDYTKNPNFTCMATSGDGYRAVGSRDGKIRLYNSKVEQIAKTSIPGLGAPITDIDVTFDGKWVLATTDSFLIVIKTIYKDGPKELCGFTSRLGNKAPAPRLLKLRREDAFSTKGAPLERAKFTWITEKGRQERYIVASCGNYTIKWNFRSIKLAEPDLVTNGLTTITTYQMIPKTEHVIDTTFMHENYAHGDDASMVVLTEKHVFNIDDTDSESDEANVRRLDF